MKNLITYLRNPVYCLGQKPKLIYFLKWFLIYNIAIISPFIIAFIIQQKFHIKYTYFGEKSTSHFNLILLGGLIVPIIEEIFFRSWLKFKRNNIILFVVGLIVLTTITTIAFFISKKYVFLDYSVFFLTILVGLFSLLYFFSIDRIELFISSKFKYFFYASVILFGLAHLGYFRGNIYLIWIFFPFLVSPQLIAGLFLGYIRMKHGLVYSILFHMLLNGVLLINFF